MELIFDAVGNTETLEQELSRLEQLPHIQSILILSCDNNGHDESSLNTIIRERTKTCFGGLFPQLIYNGRSYDKGHILLGLPYPVNVTVINNLSDTSQNLDESIQSNTIVSNETESTMFVFVDGLSSGIGRLMDSLFNHFGLEINYMGGGAGSLSLNSTPCVISNQGLHQDSAVLATIPRKSGVGVSHGWKPVSDALKVTESEGNRIISLNWQPAFSEYRQIVESHSQLSFEGEDFFNIAKAYPFGIAKLDSEMVIRDPLMRDGDNLICVGEVPQGSFVHVMHGDTESLINAAHDALLQAHADFRGERAELMIFIDCISRALFLADDYFREVRIVEEEGIPMVGALTLGEIANNGRDYLEFYNKTSVIGLLKV